MSKIMYSNLFKSCMNDLLKLNDWSTTNTRLDKLSRGVTVRRLKQAYNERRKTWMTWRGLAALEYLEETKAYCGKISEIQGQLSHSSVHQVTKRNQNLH